MSQILDRISYAGYRTELDYARDAHTIDSNAHSEERRMAISVSQIESLREKLEVMPQVEDPDRKVS